MTKSNDTPTLLEEQLKELQLRQSELENQLAYLREKGMSQQEQSTLLDHEQEHSKNSISGSLQMVLMGLLMGVLGIGLLSWSHLQLKDYMKSEMETNYRLDKETLKKEVALEMKTQLGISESVAATRRPDSSENRDKNVIISGESKEVKEIELDEPLVVPSELPVASVEKDEGHSNDNAPMELIELDGKGLSKGSVTMDTVNPSSLKDQMETGIKSSDENEPSLIQVKPVSSKIVVEPVREDTSNSFQLP